MKNIFFEILILMNIFFFITSLICNETNKDDCLKKESYKYPDVCCFYKELNKKDNSNSASSRRLQGGESSSPTIDDDEEGECKLVPYSAYYKSNYIEYIDGKLYEVTCDEIGKKPYALEECGNTYKKDKASLKECKKYSTFVDSCCYYSEKNKKDDDPVVNVTDQLTEGCYWLGSKYEGSIFWAGVRLECFNKYLQFSLYSLIFLLIEFLY